MTDFWCELAERQRKSLSEVKSSTLSSEIPIWQARWTKEWNRHRKLDYFLAQIAYWLYLNWFIQTNDPKNPKAPDRTIETFLIPFTVGGKAAPANLTPKEEFRMLTEEEKIERVKSSKRNWFRAMGLNSKGKPKAGVRYQTKKAPKKASQYVKPVKEAVN